MVKTYGPSGSLLALTGHFLITAFSTSWQPLCAVTRGKVPCLIIWTMTPESSDPLGTSTPFAETLQSFTRSRKKGKVVIKVGVAIVVVVLEEEEEEDATEGVEGGCLFETNIFFINGIERCGGNYLILLPVS